MLRLQSLADIWFLGVRKVKRMMGLHTGSTAKRQSKSVLGKITEHVTIKITVCQGYIRTTDGSKEVMK